MRLTRLLCSRIGRYSKDYANLPDSYVKRSMEQTYWKNPKGIQYRGNVKVERKHYNFDVDRPWTGEFRNDNAVGRHHRKIFVEPIKEWSYFRGDRVEILTGKDAGKQGIVMQVIQERNWVLVEGLNCEIHTMGKRPDFPGIVIQKEKPLLVTNDIALVDPSDLKGTAFEWRFTEEGDKVRVSTRTGRVIPVPASAEETIDYKSKSTYNEQSKDTLASDVTEITFQPKLSTFEMELMEKMDIKDDRVPRRTYWY